MKTPDEIKKRLEEFRQELLEKDGQAIKTTTPNMVLFEERVTLEGGIEAFKWTLEESNTLLNQKKNSLIMKNEVKENGILIALFMGAEYCNDNTKEFPNGYYMHDEFDELEPKDWRFHYSWSWLMPVVDEIETIDDFRFDIQIQNDRCTIFDTGVKHLTYDEPKIILNIMLVGEKIIAVYKAVINFIKWYNKQKKNEK